jgi:hypothetical protein
MSQLAREYLFRNQTIFEKVINNILYNIFTIIFFLITKVYYSLFNLIIRFKTENKFLGLFENENKTNIVEISSESSKEAYGSKSYKNTKLNPYYITKFNVGEGCFLIIITPRSHTKRGYYVWLAFKRKLHSKDRVLLENIRNYFNQKGKITVRKDGYIEFIVTFIKHLEVIINHFEKYPLITQK